VIALFLAFMCRFGITCDIKLGLDFKISMVQLIALKIMLYHKVHASVNFQTDGMFETCITHTNFHYLEIISIYSTKFKEEIY
jgi:hypothetical protein